MKCTEERILEEIECESEHADWLRGQIALSLQELKIDQASLRKSEARLAALKGRIGNHA